MHFGVKECIFTPLPFIAGEIPTLYYIAIITTIMLCLFLAYETV